jgi:L-ascorbate metabolism protein UlaG (beta-lactamase superfamily)
MEITWLGRSCFRLRSRETTVVMDPPSRESGISIGQPAADIVTISHDHANHNGAASCGGTPRVIQGPGEYEVGGVLIDGVQTFHDAQKGAERGRNTVYVVEMEELRVCHLGDLGHIPSAEQTEQLSGIDILLAPIGGHSTIDAAAAAEVVSLLEPKLVIPMHYRVNGSEDILEPLEPFLKQMGISQAAAQQRLQVTRSSLPLEVQVVVLELRR